MSEARRARAEMVASQVAARGIRDPRILAAMKVVPRDRFVPSQIRDRAHQDRPLPIANGQTISQPFMVALMAEALTLGPLDRVLEIGCGSGYSAAIMALLAREIFTIDRHQGLVLGARRLLNELGYENVRMRVSDGTLGWPEAAPFDAIVVAAGGPVVPAALREQLVVGGRLVMPVGGFRGDQRLYKLTRLSETDYEERDLGEVIFVPLIGAQGFAEPTDEP